MTETFIITSFRKDYIQLTGVRFYGETYQKVNSCPDSKKFKDGSFYFLNSFANMKYFIEAFPEAVWEGDAETRKREYLEFIKKEVEIGKAKEIEIISSDFHFKTKPYAHQLKAFEISKDLKSYALLFEQGCGKTKVALDNADYLFRKKRIKALIVIAPNGVHRNWINEEVPIHLNCENKSFVWDCSKFNEKMEDKFLELVADKEDVLKIFSFNIEAFVSFKTRKALNTIISFHECLVVIDESHKIKNPSAKRTKFLISLSDRMTYKRILTGTPIGNGVHDIYSQFKFLDEKIIGLSSFYAFKSKYCMMGGYEGRQIVGYRDIQDLQEKIKNNSMRVLKSECLDLPERIWQKTFFDLTTEQLTLYKEVKNESIALFNMIKGNEERDPIIIENAMTKVTKMRQIASGYFYDTQNKECIEIVPFDKNPKLLRLKELSEEIIGKIIIWTVFTKDIELILKLFGNQAVRYDGKVSQDDREINKIAFQQDENIRFFVANISAGSEGLTLNSASNVIYYNNDYSLLKRSQSEARNHRIGSKQTVVYNDLIGNKTLDNKIIKCLRNKQGIADMILQDPINFFME